MRIAIRLLTAVALVLFVVALSAEQHGEQAVATPTHPWAGFSDWLAVAALLALTVLLFIIASVLALLAAVRAGDRPWVRTTAVLALGIGLVYLGLFLPNGFLAQLVRPYQPLSPFRALLLVYLPALGGMVLLTLFSLRAPPTPPPSPPLYTTLRD